MNSLEFIDEEIEHLKFILEQDDVLQSFTDKDYKKLKDILQTLQQIKTELEAWEVVKKEIKSTYNKNNYMTIAFTYCDFIENEKYNKIKKALEVEDEDN